MKKIHTLDARNNVMLEVMCSCFNLESTQITSEIQRMRISIDSALRKKGVDYGNLRSCLEPSYKKKEAAFIFDTMEIEDSWYSAPIMNELVPLLDMNSSHSILMGDYLLRESIRETQREIFLKEITFANNVPQYIHPNQFYVVYINNLSPTALERIHNGMSKHSFYVGFADMTFQTKLKTLLSTMLVPSIVKSGKIIIQWYEPDRDANENINTLGFNFEGNGYRYVSINGDLFSIFLSYKIERPIYEGFQSDTQFSLEAMGAPRGNLDEFHIQVDSEKAEYIRNKIGDILSKELADRIDEDYLKSVIRQKISQNYIYGMEFDGQYNLYKFCITVELSCPKTSKKTRHKAVIDYQYKKNNLRLITFY